VIINCMTFIRVYITSLPSLYFVEQFERLSSQDEVSNKETPDKNLQLQ